MAGGSRRRTDARRPENLGEGLPRQVGHVGSRRRDGHQSVSQSVGWSGSQSTGTFGHTRRDIIALNIDSRLSAGTRRGRNREKNA